MTQFFREKVKEMLTDRIHWTILRKVDYIMKLKFAVYQNNFDSITVKVSTAKNNPIG